MYNNGKQLAKCTTLQAACQMYNSGKQCAKWCTTRQAFFFNVQQRQAACQILQQDLTSTIIIPLYFAFVWANVCGFGIKAQREEEWWPDYDTSNWTVLSSCVGSCVWVRNKGTTGGTMVTWLWKFEFYCILQLCGFMCLSVVQRHNRGGNGDLTSTIRILLYFAAVWIYLDGSGWCSNVHMCVSAQHGICSAVLRHHT